jgi:hypothetical protein
VSYYSGQPIRIGVNSGFYPVWGNFYPNFNAKGVFGPFNPSGFQAGDNSAPYFYLSPSVASSPINGNSVAFGNGGAYDSGLRCPGSANENASVLKYFSMGSDGQYQLQLRVEFYNLFNRHYYAINGCGGTPPTNIGSGNFAQVTGVNDNPRTGQFGVRFTF